MNLSNQQLQSLANVAKDAAIAAGEYIQSQFDQQYEKRSKEGGDSLASQVVTAVDLKAQEIILSQLVGSTQEYDLGLLTEESPDDQSRTQKDYFWCVDPMDGTLPFTEHRTGYAVSIALISKAGDPVIGVVYIPDLQELYTATKGTGVLRNNTQFKHEQAADQTIHFFMDRSFLSEPYFHKVKARLDTLPDTPMVYHDEFGGVRNAIGVMSSGRGCYFKFPKKRKGCGSIWDYAATRLFFQELGLCVSNAFGERLHLNNPKTTFMNDVGILFATDERLSALIQDMGDEHLNAADSVI